MAGVIKLGIPGALRDYHLEKRGEGVFLDESSANPFSAKVNSSSKYDEIDAWEELAFEDWQAGVGQKDPEAGGFLYSEADTRFPNQVILGQWAMPFHLKTRVELYATTTTANIITNTTTQQKIGNLCTPTTNNNIRVVWLFLSGPTNTVVTLDAAEVSGSNPGSTFATTNATITETQPGGHWLRFDFGTVARSTNFYLVVSATNPIELTSASASGGTRVWNGTAWGAYTGTSTAEFMRLFNSDGVINSTFPGYIISFNSQVYWVIAAVIYKWDSSNNRWNLAHQEVGITAHVVDVLVWNNKLWVAVDPNAPGQFVRHMNPDETVTNAPGDIRAQLLRSWNGYMYRAHQNDLYYTVDGTNWFGPFAVGPDDYEIRGMAGLGDDLYVATDDALYRFGFGDTVRGVLPFGVIDSTNGVGMIHHQGAIYIPVGQDLLRYTEDGGVGNFGINRKEGLPATRQGRVVSMASLNNFLIAAVAPTRTATSKASIWAFNDQGWHHISTFPSGITVTNIAFERNARKLWVAGIDGAHALTFRINLTNDLTNPAKDGSSAIQFAPYGWIEQHRYHGGQYKLDKDWESIYITGQNLSTLSGLSIKVYFQDEDSTAWELLGTVTADNTELRWDDYDVRPDGKWLRLGLLLQTNSRQITPILEAVVIKFLPMVMDRNRWVLQIPIHDTRQMPDNTIGPYTIAQQKAHIASLVSRVKPIIFQDIDGVQYEVKIVDKSIVPVKYEYYADGNQVQYLATLVLEQITDGVFVG